MFAVMAYVWTCKEVTSVYVTMVLRHPKTRLCAWVRKILYMVCLVFLGGDESKFFTRL